MRSTAVYIAALVILSTGRADAEIWNCALTGLFPKTNYFVQIDDSTATLGMIGSDLVEEFRISKNTNAELVASRNDEAGHQDMKFNKRKSNMRIVVRRLAGDIAFVQTGQCVRKAK